MAKTNSEHSLYFLAVVLPDPHAEKVWKLKYYFRDVYGSKASLNSPPHITLHMPFQWKAAKEEMLLQNLHRFFLSCLPVPIQFRNFGCFSPRVIFIEVEKSAVLENLQRNLVRFCRQELNLFNANYQDQSFRPHVTLAFRDLKKPMFIAAWNEFGNREFIGEFTANRAALLKHNGKIWEVFRQFELGTTVS